MALPTLEELIENLPPFKNDRDVIARRQTIDDIISEVLECHNVFSKDYDRIAGYFAYGNTMDICRSLFQFCINNLPYLEESEDDQTTRSPGGIVDLALMGYPCDCKHYAGFIAGVLGALNRTGKRIDWYYRFCSYNHFRKKPGHVFTVVRVGKKEVWIDPTPVENLQRSFNDRLIIPIYYTDEKNVMALTRLSGCGDNTMGLFELEKDPSAYGDGGGSDFIESGYPTRLIPYAGDDTRIAIDPGYIPDTEVMPTELATTETDIITTNTIEPAPQNGPIKFSVINWMKANPLLTVTLGAAVAWGIYELLKPKKRR